MKRENCLRRIESLVLVLAVAMATGCGTVAPKTNESKRASYDRQDTTVATSGILGFAKNDQGQVTGRIVSLHFRDRYNALIETYGDQFTPELKFDEGVTECEDQPDGTHASYVIDREHFVKMGQMIQWKRNGRIPTSGFNKLLKKVF